MNKLSEEYYRCDYETAKLLKEAGFDKPCAVYRFVDTLNNNIDFYSRPFNFNSHIPPFEQKVSMPLIDIALEWLNQKGYFRDGISVYKMYQRLPIATIDLDTENKRQYDLDYIKACCIDLINK